MGEPAGEYLRALESRLASTPLASVGSTTTSSMAGSITTITERVGSVRSYSSTWSATRPRQEIGSGSRSTDPAFIVVACSSPFTRFSRRCSSRSITS